MKTIHICQKFCFIQCRVKRRIEFRLSYEYGLLGMINIWNSSSPPSMDWTNRRARDNGIQLVIPEFNFFVFYAEMSLLRIAMKVWRLLTNGGWNFTLIIFELAISDLIIEFCHFDCILSCHRTIDRFSLIQTSRCNSVHFNVGRNYRILNFLCTLSFRISGMANHRFVIISN